MIALTEFIDAHRFWLLLLLAPLIAYAAMIAVGWGLMGMTYFR
jgi:hypothetical protein